VDLLRPEVQALDLVVAARYGSLVPWWAHATDADRDDGRVQLARVGCGHLADRTFGTLSSGERQRVMLARTLITDPALLLLDEPGATLDLGGREQLISTLDALADEAGSPPVVFVTHHVEEIPRRFTHGALLRDGQLLFAGPLADALDEARMSDCFGLDLQIDHHHGRWWAQGRGE
jgi:iron complex transport system ATP-binding protein